MESRAARRRTGPSRVALGVGLAALLTACGTKAPTLRVQGLKVGGLGLSGAGIDVAFMVRNRNPEPLRIERFEYELFVNGYRLGRGYYPDPLELGGFEDERVVSGFDLNFLSLPGTVRTLLERDRVEARAKGKFYVLSGGGGLKALRFNSKAEVRLKR